MNQNQDSSGMLSGIFGARPPSGGEMFTHPNEEDILISAIDTLKKSATGAHLLGVLNHCKIGARVIKSRTAHGYAPSNDMIFLGAPAHLGSADAFTVLELAAAIREIEQNLVGFTLPPEGADPLEIASARHAKTLDIIAYMCRVALELEVEIGPASYVEAIESLGLGEALMILVSQLGDKGMVEAYERAHKKVQ